MCKDIFINKKTWNTFTEQEMSEYVDLVYTYYSKKGFPYYPTNIVWRKKEFNKLIKYQKEMLDGDTIRQTMHGLALAWSYHPYAFDISCNGLKSPLETFNKNLRKVIIKRTKMGDNISDAGLRKMLRIYTGTQGVSNFRPTAARGIYNEFEAKVVWDMSVGFGGRLLGFETSNALEYIGTDPNRLAIEGNTKLALDFCKKSITLIEKGSEDYIPEPKSLDVAFTSPPYFDIEKYSDHPSQSYKRFPNYDDWVEGFLVETFRNAYYGLKDSGFLIINIAGDSLERDTVKSAERVGFKHLKTLKLALSNVKMKNKKSAFKFEPVFVFQKKKT